MVVNSMQNEDQTEVLSVLSAEEDLAQNNLNNIRTTTRLPATEDQSSVPRAGGGDPVQRGDWKMEFKRAVCSSTSFPTEAVVWINEVDSAENIEEFK